MKVTSKSWTVKSNGASDSGLEEGAGPEVVVLAQGVGEAVLGDHDDAALETPQPPDGEPDQHDQHREVEQQVARLARVPALGADRSLVPVGAVAAPAQVGVGRLEDGLGLLVGLEGHVLGQPGEVARCLRRPGPYAAPVDAQPRDDAADQRDHQQDVDGREPHRVVDREEAELLVDRRQGRVLRAPLGGTHRVDGLLRHDRPGHRGERQQEEQDQRGPHRGELAPGPARQLERGERGRPLGGLRRLGLRGGRGCRSSCVTVTPPT